MAPASPIAGRGRHYLRSHELSEEKVARLRESLLLWFAGNARELPWRIPPVSYGSASYQTYVDRLYRCLISETMLQQTQVKTVIAYYTKWLEKFPTIDDLAKADEEEVMACWAGLGYYSRAKRLQQAAQYLVENFVSKELEFPREPEHWIKKVPGAGPYTSGAILSISFGIPSAIIDGNVQRVLSRVLAVHGDTSTPKSAGSKLLWERAAQLVEGPEPGNLNQALMELGATICTPTLPSCKACPISADCLAYRQQLQLKPASKGFFDTRMAAKADPAALEPDVPDLEDVCEICPASIDTRTLPANPDAYIHSLYPFKPPKKAQREESAIVVIVQRAGGQELYLERKAAGLLAGLYDFPTVLVDAPADVPRLVDRHERQLGARRCGQSTHLFTHIRRTSFVLTCEAATAERALASFAAANGTGRWVAATALDDLGVSELCRKNLRLLTGLDKPGGGKGRETAGALKRQGEAAGVASAKRTKARSDGRGPVGQQSTLSGLVRARSRGASTAAPQE